jgi:hypothetical protein
MVVGARRTGIRIGVVRAAIELSALVAGFVLGGRVGAGTLAFAVLIGPSVEAAFWSLLRSGLAERGPGVRLPDVAGVVEPDDLQEVAHPGGPQVLP